MNLAKTYLTYHRLMRNQWLGRDAIRNLQITKLRALVRHAFDTVPFYQTRFKQSGILPEHIVSIEDLKKMPIVRKSDMQLLAQDQIISSRYNKQALKVERTSGSTGQPFSIFFDADFVMLRNLLFLRGLRTSGYKFGQRILLISDIKENKGSRKLQGWHYVSILELPEYHLKMLNQIRPAILYGCKTSLKLLAQYIVMTKSDAHAPKKIISTAESLDNLTKSLLQETFHCEVYDFYGLTEMGLTGWECHFHQGYHISEDVVIFEYVPAENVSGAFKVVMTNLHALAMPLIRYETGDIVFAGENSPCDCGRGFARFERIEGRMADVIHTRNGIKISPYRLTCALEKLPGLRTYQVIQESLKSIRIRVETDGFGGEPIEGKIRSVVRHIVGDGTDIVIENAGRIMIEPGQKFRVIESRVRR